MKKVQPTLTLGHITFLLLAFFISSGMFFYLGAKFGPGVIVFDGKPGDDRAILPDEAVAEEARKILAQTGHAYVFHDVLQGNTSLEADLPKASPQVKAASFFTKDDLINLNDDTSQKDVKPLAKTDAKLLVEPNAKSLVKIEKPTAPINLVPNSEPQMMMDASKPNLSPEIEPSASEKTLAKKAEATLKDNKPVTTKEKAPVKPVQQPKAIQLADLPPEPLPQEPADEPIVEEPKSSAAYRLQIGSYSDKAKAEKALQEWRSRGFSARVITTEVPGKGIWYRLNLGSYDDASSAQKAQSEISAKFRQTPMVVSNR